MHYIGKETNHGIKRFMGKKLGKKSFKRSKTVHRILSMKTTSPM